jgi:GTPase
MNPRAGIAQLVERELPKLEVAGSNPVARSMYVPASGAPALTRNAPGAPGLSRAMSAPVVAIIGRPNVGKSTFFNRVLGERRAVVHDRPGITRDRNAVRTEWAGKSFLLIDTGGFLPDSSEGRDRRVREQAEAAIGLADLVVFMVDARTGATDLDQAIAQSLRRRGTPALLVVNKVDKPGDPVMHDFHRLGLGDPIPVSSENGFGIGDLLDRVLEKLPVHTEKETTAKGRIAIIGRPNVGKSSIVNALLGEHRMIVETQAGTTLDAIDSRWKTDAGEFILVDTAGIRRQAHFGDESEFFATVRALAALERADVAGLVVDAVQGFQRQEARLAHDALDAGCSLLLIYNKWDLIEGRDVAWKRLTHEREQRYPTLAEIPSIPISATEGTHLGKLPRTLEKRVVEHHRKLTTRQINDWLKVAQARRQVTSTSLGQSPRIYYATQTHTGPPVITLFVNEPSRLSSNYRKFLLHHMTSHFGFTGTPVRLNVRRSD